VRKLIHVTCVAHRLHRVAEYIWKEHSDADIWISNLKKVFLKAPFRVEIFKKYAPYLQLHPKPILTRWGTRKEAFIYSSKKFNKLKQIISKIDDDNSIAIRKCKKIMNSSKLEADLLYISKHYECIPKVIDHFFLISLKVS
jgi:hypothetical protein